MSDHLERACVICGSLLHSGDACPRRIPYRARSEAYPPKNDLPPTVSLVRDTLPAQSQYTIAPPRKHVSPKTYPPPADVGEPPDIIREWAEKIIATWGLTPKERVVCDLLLKGLATAEIAEVTGNTEKTLKHYIAAIFKKSHCGSRAELFAEILRL